MNAPPHRQDRRELRDGRNVKAGMRLFYGETDKVSSVLWASNSAFLLCIEWAATTNSRSAAVSMPRDFPIPACWQAQSCSVGFDQLGVRLATCRRSTCAPQNEVLSIFGAIRMRPSHIGENMCLYRPSNADPETY